MKKLTYTSIAFLLILALNSCKKSKDARIDEFLSAYKQTFAKSVNISPEISSTSAEKTAEDEVTIHFNMEKTSDSLELKMLSESLPELISTAIASENLSKNLMEDGVKFKVKVESGSKVLKEQTFTKNDLGNGKKIEALVNDKNSRESLDAMLEIFNKNLPMTDPNSGIKIMKISTGDNQDIVYTAEMSEETGAILKMDGAETLIKEEIMRNPQIKTILQKASQFNINSLKYRFVDKNGKIIKDIIINKNDF